MHTFWIIYLNSSENSTKILATASHMFFEISLNFLVAIGFSVTERPDDGGGCSDEGNEHEEDRHSRQYHGGEVAGLLIARLVLHK